MQVSDMIYYLEDIIAKLEDMIFLGIVKMSPIDTTIMASFSHQLHQGNYLTEKQNNLALKILKKYNKQLSTAWQTDFAAILPQIVNKNPPRTITTTKTISINDENPPKIEIKFPFDANCVEELRKYKKLTNDNFILWDADKKAWIFPLKDCHLEWLLKTMPSYGFTFDQKIIDFDDIIEDIKNNMEKYIPMLCKKEGKFIYQNISSKIQPTNKITLLSAIVEARNNGIFVWDDEIEKELTCLDWLNPIILKSLSSVDRIRIKKDAKLTFMDVKPLIFSIDPIMVIIPGGNELKHLEFYNTVFTRNGIEPEEMTVLFRLDNKESKKFNDFVKNSKLNNPISEKIKVFFVNHKIPKPFIKSKIHIPIIFNTGLSGVNYIMMDFIEAHHFVVNFSITEQEFALV